MCAPLSKTVRLAVCAVVWGFASCEEPAIVDEPWVEQSVAVDMTLAALGGSEAIYNLPVEYAILNLSIFVADAGSETFTNKFVYQTFSANTSSDDPSCKRVTFPSTFKPVGAKDVYVIANHDNAASLSAINTVADLRALRTPRLSQGHLIPFERGLPMYGESFGVEFSEAEPVHIHLTRTCSKIDFNLSFPDPTWVGTNNRAAILEAQSYTYYVPNSTEIPATDLVQYPEVILRPQPDPTKFQATIYIYESRYYLSYISIKTVVAGKNKEYVINSNVPLPVRNHMYTVLVEILHPLTGPDAKATARVKTIMNY
ncbi:MAG: hypothetical protein LBM63_03045 [Rikenellaceae bacterium]|nr:hypothetical protein [Rikenellaceae bacterium]